MENVNVFPMVYKHRVNATGELPVVICITLNRKLICYDPLHKKIMLNDWDFEKRISKTNKLLNAIILKRKSELEAEFTKRQLLGENLTKTLIKRIVAGEAVGKDYFEFCRELIPNKFPNPDQHETRRQHLSELTKLAQFKSEVTFADIDYKFLSDYKAWMIIDRLNAHNTVWKSLKAFNSMLNTAVKMGGYIKENPFKNFDRGKYKQHLKNFLELSDLDKITEVLEKDLPEKLRTIIYYYLFMCYTGLRFRDAVVNFDCEKHIANNERIVMITEKSKQEVNLLIHDRLKIVVDYIKENKLVITNQDFNRYLKILQTMANINFDLSAHSGRHTFGAMLAEMDVPIEKAQKLMGHKDKKSTEIYYHIKNKSLDTEMQKWDRLPPKSGELETAN